MHNMLVIRLTLDAVAVHFVTTIGSKKMNATKAEYTSTYAYGKKNIRRD